MEKKARFVNADELMEQIEKTYCVTCKATGQDYNEVRCRACWVDDMLLEIDSAHTVEAAPVVHGRWLLEREPDGTPYCLHCSACDGDFSHIGITTTYPYCPNCGAKMDVSTVHE